MKEIYYTAFILLITTAAVSSCKLDPPLGPDKETKAINITPTTGTGSGTGTGAFISTADDGSDYPAAAQGTISYQIGGGSTVVKNGPSLISNDPSIFSNTGQTIISYINANATELFQLEVSTLNAGTYDIASMNIGMDATFLNGKAKFTTLNHSSPVKGNAVGTFKAELKNFNTGVTYIVVGSFNIKS